MDVVSKYSALEKYLTPINLIGGVFAILGVAATASWAVSSTTQKSETRIDSLERLVEIRFEAVDRRFDAVDKRFDGIESTLIRLESKMESMDERLRTVQIQQSVTK